MIPANHEYDHEPVADSAPAGSEFSPALVASMRPPASERAAERAVVRADGLSKQYRSPWTRRTVDALTNVSFEIHPERQTVAIVETEDDGDRVGRAGSGGHTGCSMKRDAREVAGEEADP